MICIEKVMAYCSGDYTKIENYDEAITDTTQTWLCHHRLGIRPFSKKTLEKMSKAKKGKPSPRKGVKLSEEHKRKLAEAKKGKKCFTNGEVIIYAFECPKGFVRGRKLCK